MTNRWSGSAVPNDHYTYSFRLVTVMRRLECFEGASDTVAICVVLFGEALHIQSVVASTFQRLSYAPLVSSGRHISGPFSGSRIHRNRRPTTAKCWTPSTGQWQRQTARRPVPGPRAGLED